VTTEPSGNCGPYYYSRITNSNGFNTYVGNNCWDDPSCQQTITVVPNAPTTKDQCKNNGWRSFTKKSFVAFQRSRVPIVKFVAFRFASLCRLMMKWLPENFRAEHSPVIL